ncbi:MAG: Ig-like domain-containing protein, partial [Bacteroidetes bacterium]|nr:Ig-like domain-containing protein [Bacteroidota bacterium]
MKIKTLKSVLKSLFLALIILTIRVEFSFAQNENLKTAQTTNQNNRLLGPIQITGNTSICLPGPSTTQLTGSGGSGVPHPTTPWSSSNTPVATVDNTGLVTAVGFGSTSIGYSDNAGNQTFVNVYVSAYPTVTGPSPTEACAAGGTVQLTGSLFPNASTPWTSANTSIATVDNFGLVTGVAAGTVNITYMNLGGCTASIPVTIKPLLSPTISCGVPTYNSVTFTWPAVTNASTYTVVYSINSGGYVFGTSGNILTWTKNGLNPGDSVTVFITPIGAGGNCFIGASQTCQALSCDATSTPTAPVIGTITQPTCSTPTGSVQLTGLPAGTWTINPGAITGSGATYTVSGLATGSYTFTVKNSFGCTSVASASATINAQPPTPSAPTIGTITQPTCSTATGSIELTGLPAGTWTINPGAIAGSGATYTVSGLAAAASYTFTVTNSVGCPSAASASTTINAQPPTPSAPTIGTVTQPTCSTATGSIELTGLPAGTWTINPGAIAGSGATYTISGLTASNYSYTVTNSVGCTSAASTSTTINAQPPTPSAPTIGTVTQPTCSTATGSVQLTGLPAGTWTINPGAIAGSGATYTVSGLAAAASYTFTVTN